MSTTSPTTVPPVVDGPGRIGAGQRVSCLPGSLPARDGGQGGGVLVSIGLTTSVVDVYGGGRRRIRNELLHPRAGSTVAAQQRRLGLPTTTASGRGWLPRWSWLDWTVQQHVEYQRGERTVPSPPPPPKRLIIVACGARKKQCLAAPAGELYVGSYHRAARRAAAALTTPDTRVMIVSALYGLMDLTDDVLVYEQRLGKPGAITAEFVAEQARQLGLVDAAEVIVLAPKGYAALATHVWPHAQQPLAGTRGIGEQLARFAALAAGHTGAPAATTSAPATERPAGPGGAAQPHHRPTEGDRSCSAPTTSPRTSAPRARRRSATPSTPRPWTGSCVTSNRWPPATPTPHGRGGWSPRPSSRPARTAPSLSHGRETAVAATSTRDRGPAGAEAGWQQPELFAVASDPARTAPRAPRRAGPRPIAEPEVLPLIWPDPPGLIRGARYRREVVRLSAAGRARAGGLLHIERPPLVVNGQRLDFTTTALCGAGLAWPGPRNARSAWPSRPPAAAAGGSPGSGPTTPALSTRCTAPTWRCRTA